MKSKKCPKCGYVCSETAPFCKGCGTAFPNAGSMEVGESPSSTHAVVGGSESYTLSAAAPSFANYSGFAPTSGEQRKKLAQTSLAMAFAALIWSRLYEQLGAGTQVLAIILMLTSLPLAITALFKVRSNPLLYGGKRFAQAALSLCALLVLLYAMAIPALITARLPKPVKTEWRQFDNEDGKFTVRMPGVAKHDLKYFPASDASQVPMHTYTVDLERKGVCLSGYADFTGFRLMGSTDTFLDNAAEGTYQYGEMSILSKKSITLHGFEGRELLLKPNSVKYGDATFAIARLYLVYPRLYIIIIAGPNSSELYDERFKYLDSFRTYNTPLIEAAETGKGGLTQLIEQSTDEKEKDIAFVRAGRKGKQVALRTLNNAGVSVNAKDDSGRTALMMAAAYSKPSVEALMEYGPGITFGRPAVPVESTVAFLIGRGANLDAQDTDRQWTALIWAIEEGDGTNSALTLIKAGADVNIKDRNGETALTHAKKVNRVEIVEALKQAGAKE